MRFYMIVTLLALLSPSMKEFVVTAETVTSGIRGWMDRSLQTVQVGKVDKLILYNAITDLPLLALEDGMVLNTATLNGTSFNIEATTVNGTVGSVKFGYNGRENVRIESLTPYALCGDNNANYNVCSYLVVGQHNLTVTSYSGIHANGTIGFVRKVSIRMVHIATELVVSKSPTKAPSQAPVTKVPITSPSTPTPTIQVPVSLASKSPTKASSQAPVMPVPINTATPAKSPSILTPTVQVPVSPVSKSPTKAPSQAPVMTIPINTGTPAKPPTIHVPVSCNIPKVNTTWQKFAPEYPLVSTDAQSNLVGNDVVIFGGFNGNFTAATNQSYARDISEINRPWRRMEDMPVAIGITHAATVVIGMKIYMCGGFVGPPPGPHVAHCFIYDHSKAPGTGQWSNFTSLPNNGTAGGGMIYDTVRNALYYSGGAQMPRLGSRLAIDQNSTWKFSFNNPSSGWVASTPIPYNANHQSYVTVRYQGLERHFFAGGQLGQNEMSGNVADTFEFIASTETWVRRASIPYGRSHTTTSTRANGCGFIMAGGAINGFTLPLNRTNEIHYYHIPSDSWTYVTTLPRRNVSPKVFMDEDNDYMYYVDWIMTSRLKLFAK